MLLFLLLSKKSRTLFCYKTSIFSLTKIGKKNKVFGKAFKITSNKNFVFSPLLNRKEGNKGCEGVKTKKHKIVTDALNEGKDKSFAYFLRSLLTKTTFEKKKYGKGLQSSAFFVFLECNALGYHVFQIFLLSFAC